MILMAEKKNKGRFTIQFNPSDPHQLKVAELLEQQGRHKAQFLTSVVLHYIHCEETPDITQSFPIDSGELEKRIMEILERMPAHCHTKETGESFSVDKDFPQKPDSELKSMFGPEVSSAIANTLSAFCRE